MLRNRPATLIALLAAIILLGLNFVADVDVFQFGVWLVEHLQARRIDDCLAALLLVIAGLLIDHNLNANRLKHETQIQSHRLGVLKATMRTVQDIVNNFLNNLQLITLEAGEALSLPTRELLDTVIHDTAEKLRALGDLNSTPEMQMPTGRGIDFKVKFKATQPQAETECPKFP